MEELLAVKRMLELEKMAIDSNIVYPLSLQEWKYVERAEKIPYEEVANSIDYIIKHLFVVNQKKIMKELEKKYLVSENELYQRFEDVYRIIRYKKDILNQQLDNQKEMLKRMWS